MSERKSLGIQAIVIGVLAAAAILFGNLETTKTLLVKMQATDGTPKMLADLVLNPAFQLRLVLVAISLGVRAIKTSWRSRRSGANCDCPEARQGTVACMGAREEEPDKT